ncbi:heterokaryon incompatibility protein-domain-containing protein [Bombardia bombarda]|uniref:Heterokaryon incompatibility protein-domain-containing protein n=1 Tax=Bombardia bombarda TaxID=252184 RepID=A0AA39WV24_9PEZI|nr:heterokaryon incompatibility protein-domain-containing protein [Bombardia bombarda]
MTGKGHSASIPSVRLYRPDPSDKQPPPYVALSHCWGPKETAKKRLLLTRDVMQNFDRNIEWDAMPETFQDGIMVAWRLGIRHVWIDSLCIIQQDKEDWTIEAPKMGDYYANAYLTVSASSSACGDEKFLRPRPGIIAQAEEIKYYGPESVSMTAKIGRGLKMKRGTMTIPGPLSSRAWTLQERILSTRVVHFTDEGTVWECQEDTRSEDHRVRESGPLRKWQELEAPSSMEGEKEARKMRNKIQASWRHLVAEYTQRQLTERSDIMAAISSIAARMHGFIGAPYLAGLWQDRFVEDLCWRPEVSYGEKVPLLTPEDIELNMPTWSWMSIRHAVSHTVIGPSLGAFVSHCSLVEHGQVTRESNQFMELASGRSVVVKGRIVEMEITFHGHLPSGDAKSAAVRLDTYYKSYNSGVLMDVPLVSVEAVSPASGKMIQTARRGRQGDRIKGFHGTIYCLELGRWMPAKTRFALGGVDHHFVMVLAPSVTTPGAYERLGMLDNTFGGGYKGSTRRQVWGDVTPTLVTLV